MTEFFEAFPGLSGIDLTARDETQLRRNYVDAESERWRSPDLTGPEDWIRGSTTRYRPVSTIEGVRRLLDRHAEREATDLVFRATDPETGEELESRGSASDRWGESYQREHFAKIQGGLRELTGGERPSGGEAPGTMESPTVAMFSRTASSVPNGRRLPLVDHANEMAESWSPVRDALRNLMEKDLEVPSEAWVYDVEAEPHPGDGLNAGYSHEHVIVVFDAAETDAEVTPETFGPVIDAHVRHCGPARDEGHGPGTVVIADAQEDFGSVGAYVGAYSAAQAADLFDRGPKFWAFAAAYDAGNLRVRRRSDRFKWAATADKCEQAAEREQDEQDRAHGACVVHSPGRGYAFQCADCGSPHRVPQDENEVRRQRRLAGPLRDDGPAAAVADGGEETTRVRVVDRETGEVETDAEVRSAWPDRPPPDPSAWRLDAVARDGEEWSVSPGGGVEMVAVDVDGAEYECPACGAASRFERAVLDHYETKHGGTLFEAIPVG